jgi:hypothetical protein
MRTYILAALLLGLVAPIRRDLPAQTYNCVSATNEHSTALRDDVISLVTGTDSRVVNKRNTYQLLAASTAQVSIVTLKNTCKNAALAYHAAVNPPGTPAISRNMVVIKIANNRYVITDPTYKTGEFGMVMVTDGGFNVLSKFSS